MEEAGPLVARLVSPELYQAPRQNVFNSKTSMDWFIRSRREKLIGADALLMCNGRLLIDPQAFDAVVIEDGRAKLFEAA